MDGEKLNHSLILQNQYTTQSIFLSTKKANVKIAKTEYFPPCNLFKRENKWSDQKQAKEETVSLIISFKVQMNTTCRAPN